MDWLSFGIGVLVGGCLAVTTIAPLWRGDVEELRTYKQLASFYRARR